MQGIRADGVEMKPTTKEESEKYNKSNINDYFKSNRDRFLEVLSNRQIAIMITSMNDNWNTCKRFCPIKSIDCVKIGCVEKIEKWLGEKA